MALARWLPAGTRLKFRHDVGDLRPQGDLVDPVRPPDVAGLHREVELVAHVGTGRAAVGGGAVARPGLGVHRVDLAAVRTDAEDLGPAPRRRNGSAGPCAGKARPHTRHGASVLRVPSCSNVDASPPATSAQVVYESTASSIAVNT